MTDTAHELSLIMDKYDASCPEETAELQTEINNKFISRQVLIDQLEKTRAYYIKEGRYDYTAGIDKAQYLIRTLGIEQLLGGAIAETELPKYQLRYSEKRGLLATHLTNNISALPVAYKKEFEFIGYDNDLEKLTRFMSYIQEKYFSDKTCSFAFINKNGKIEQLKLELSTFEQPEPQSQPESTQQSDTIPADQKGRFRIEFSPSRQAFHTCFYAQRKTIGDYVVIGDGYNINNMYKFIDVIVNNFNPHPLHPLPMTIKQLKDKFKHNYISK